MNVKTRELFKIWQSYRDHNITCYGEDILSHTELN